MKLYVWRISFRGQKVAYGCHVDSGVAFAMLAKACARLNDGQQPCNYDKIEVGGVTGATLQEATEKAHGDTKDWLTSMEDLT